MTEDRLLSVAELAEYVGVAKATIYDWNYRGGGPKPTRIGGKFTRYRRSDVERWIADMNSDASAA